MENYKVEATVSNSIREARRTKKQRKKIINSILYGSIGVVILLLIMYLIWDGLRPAAGEAIPIMANAGNHVAEGMDPGPFNSDPITSGPHYAEEYDAGFYDETSPEAQAPYPEGYLGHNLEHGYIIYWYNCALLNAAECTDLKNQIKKSLSDNGGTKLIAFPDETIDNPVVMTSWGQMLRFENFDEGQARKFVQANRNRAPEPNAP